MATNPFNLKKPSTYNGLFTPEKVKLYNKAAGDVLYGSKEKPGLFPKVGNFIKQQAVNVRDALRGDLKTTKEDVNQGAFQVASGVAKAGKVVAQETFAGLSRIGKSVISAVSPKAAQSLSEPAIEKTIFSKETKPYQDTARKVGIALEKFGATPFEKRLGQGAVLAGSLFADLPGTGAGKKKLLSFTDDIIKTLAKETDELALSTAVKSQAPELGDEAVKLLSSIFKDANTENEVRTVINSINYSKGEPLAGLLPVADVESGLAKNIESRMNAADPKIVSMVKTLNEGKDLPPVPVKIRPDGKFELNKDGAHRLIAYREAGRPSIPIRLETPTELTSTAKQFAERELNAVTPDIPPPGTAQSRLMDAIRSADRPRKELEAKYSAERSRRAGAVGGIFEQGKGQKGYYQALGQLKGELTDKPKFSAVALDQRDLDELFNQVQQHPTLDIYEKVSAANGLEKLLKGEIPPTSQLSLMEDVFGSDLIREVLKKRSLVEKGKDLFTEIMNIPRSLITTLDMSAPLRQGVVFTLTKPKTATKAFGEMFRQTFAPKNFEKWLKEDLPKHPLYPLMKDSGLYISNPLKVAPGLAAKEERFMTNLASKIPFYGGVMRASERAYSSYLNKLRVDVFSQLVDQFISEGIDPRKNPDSFKSLAKFINNATGRGDIKMGAQALNSVFFSPRLIAARFNMLNPVWYARQTPEVRREAIKTMAKFVGAGATILAISKAAGADVELDPRSTDFGKVRVGNTRWDMWGGFQQWVRVFTQLATGQRKTQKGDIVKLNGAEYPFESRKDVAERFFVGKLAPVPSLGYELLQGQKLFGEKITLPKELIENTIPLYLQDLETAFKDKGVTGALTTGVPAFFGVGVQNYTDTKAINPFSSGGSPRSTSNSGSNPFNR